MVNLKVLIPQDQNRARFNKTLGGME